MYQILIWGTGYGYNQYINLLKYQELLNEIKIVGITGKDMLYDQLDGYPFWPIFQLTKERVDYIVVTSDINFSEIVIEAEKLGFSEDMFIRAKVLALPGFLFSKYISIQSSKISIISNNCWGGTLYHSLGMKFYSPFINMFENDKEYLKLLSDLKVYLDLKLEFIKDGFNPVLNMKYPICLLGDVELHFNHYPNMDEVELKWSKRVKRINWDNLFVMMFTESEQIAREFDRLDYNKKICFVPFRNSYKSSYYLQIVDRYEMRNIPFWEIVNKIASGHYQDYDLIDLLQKGKIDKSRC